MHEISLWVGKLRDEKGKRTLTTQTSRINKKPRTFPRLFDLNIVRWQRTSQFQHERTEKLQNLHFIRRSISVTAFIIKCMAAMITFNDKSCYFRCFIWSFFIFASVVAAGGFHRVESFFCSFVVYVYLDTWPCVYIDFNFIHLSWQSAHLTFHLSLSLPFPHTDFQMRRHPDALPYAVDVFTLIWICLCATDLFLYACNSIWHLKCSSAAHILLPSNGWSTNKWNEFD